MIYPRCYVGDNMQTTLNEYSVDYFDWIPDVKIGSNGQAVFIQVWPIFLTYSRTKTDTYKRFHWSPASLWDDGRFVDWGKWI